MSLFTYQPQGYVYKKGSQGLGYYLDRRANLHKDATTLNYLSQHAEHGVGSYPLVGARAPNLEKDASNGKKNVNRLTP